MYTYVEDLLRGATSSRGLFVIYKAFGNGFGVRYRILIEKMRSTMKLKLVLNLEAYRQQQSVWPAAQIPFI